MARYWVAVVFQGGSVSVASWICRVRRGRHARSALWVAGAAFQHRGAQHELQAQWGAEPPAAWRGHPVPHQLPQVRRGVCVCVCGSRWVTLIDLCYHVHNRYNHSISLTADLGMTLFLLHWLADRCGGTFDIVLMTRQTLLDSCCLKMALHPSCTNANP